MQTPIHIITKDGKYVLFWNQKTRRLQTNLCENFDDECEDYCRTFWLDNETKQISVQETNGLIVGNFSNTIQEFPRGLCEEEEHVKLTSLLEDRWWFLRCSGSGLTTAINNVKPIVFTPDFFVAVPAVAESEYVLK